MAQFVWLQQTIALRITATSTACTARTPPRAWRTGAWIRTAAQRLAPRVQPAPTLAATMTCLPPAPTLAASTHACSQHLRLQPAPTRAASTHACSSTHACRHHARLQPAPNACRRDLSPANAQPYHRDAMHFFSPLTLCPYSQLNVLKVLHLLPTHCFLTLSEFSVFSRSKLSFSALLISFFFGFRALGVLPPTSCNRVFLSL